MKKVFELLGSPFRKELTQRGFLLIEAMIFIGILIAILALVLPKMLGGADKKNMASVMKQIEGISGGLLQYKNDVGSYPDRLNKLYDKSVVDVSKQAYWKNPYLDIPSKKGGAGGCTAAVGDFCDPNVAGLAYSFEAVRSSGGGESNCTHDVMGTNNSAGADYTIKMTGVPIELANLMKNDHGDKICVVAGGTETTNAYYIFDEAH